MGGQLIVFCYSSNGLSMRSVNADYVAQNGEVLFPNCATDEELATVFADYTTQKTQTAVIEYTSMVQAHLDDTAKTRNYDGILSLCTYATSTNPTFAKEGQAGVVWRDAVWAKCYAIIGEVKAGTRATPTTDELFAELPLFTWGD